MTEHMHVAWHVQLRRLTQLANSFVLMVDEDDEVVRNNNINAALVVRSRNGRGEMRINL